MTVKVNVKGSVHYKSYISIRVNGRLIQKTGSQTRVVNGLKFYPTNKRITIQILKNTYKTYR